MPTASRPARPRRYRRPEPAPGVARVRIEGDTVAADVLAEILRGHPAVEILTGPDRYPSRYGDGRQYLAVRVLSAAEVLAAIGQARGTADDAPGTGPRCESALETGMPGSPERCNREPHGDGHHDGDHHEWWDDESDGGSE